jgi:N-acetylneuraminic acid mutarotase
MPTARGGFGVAVVNGKIYAIGGINGDNEPLNTVEEYNPVTDGWTSKTSMPTPRTGFAIAVYSNKIYVIGGSIGNVYVGNNEVYDPVSNTWTTKASMPTPRADLCANTVNGNIYLIGGKRYSSSDPYYIETDVNEVYYPVNDSWSTKTALPTAVQGYGSAVVDNKIYIIGGSRQPTSSGTSTLVNNNQVYDTTTDTWSRAAPISNTVSYGSAAATQGYLAPQEIYYVGGFSNGQSSAITKAYTVSNNSWSNIEPMPTARGYLSLVVIDDVLFAIGGFDGTNWLGTNEHYKPSGYGTVPPRVQITSPENRTYRDVTVSYTVNRGVQWIGYCLDGHRNVTLTSEVRLSGLSQGSHCITIYANDSSGNMAVSNSVYFSVDTLAPNIVILAPTNQSYDAVDVQLTFIVNEGVSSLAYSLDGQALQAIIGNVTLVALSNGQHKLTVYANDDLGNAGQQTVYFTIAPFPMLLVIAVLVIAIIAVAGLYIVFKMKKTGNPRPASAKSATS